ncbi:MAG: hypothetical protein M3P27_13600 [Acidobacteriota bacterium]|nr:hypothetical protein [Acidobacteriota bacterium]
MKLAFTISVVTCLLLIPLQASLTQNGPAKGCGDPAACKLIEQAIEDAKSLKVGMYRSDVERQFRADGGMTFMARGEPGTEHARYVYKRCPNIKVNVDLAAEVNHSGVRPSPVDRITKISKPYLEYPAYD